MFESDNVNTITDLEDAVNELLDDVPNTKYCVSNNRIHIVSDDSFTKIFIDVVSSMESFELVDFNTDETPLEVGDSELYVIE